MRLRALCTCGALVVALTGCTGTSKATSRATTTTTAAPARATEDATPARAARLAVLAAVAVLKDPPNGARVVSTTSDEGADGTKPVGPSVTQELLLAGADTSVLGPVADHYIRLLDQPTWGERVVHCVPRGPTISVTAGQNAESEAGSWPLRASVVTHVDPAGLAITVKLTAPHPSLHPRFVRTAAEEVWSGCGGPT